MTDYQNQQSIERCYIAAQNAGFKNLKHLSQLSGESSQTLIAWFSNNPNRFENILHGCMRFLPTQKEVVTLRREDYINTPLIALFER